MMSTAGPRLNKFGSVWSHKGELPGGGLPSGDSLLESIRSYDYVLQHRLGGVEVLDAKAYDELPDDLLELRAFNGCGELHLVCAEGEWLGRVRTDASSKDAADALVSQTEPAKGAADALVSQTNASCKDFVCVTVFDEEHRIWGTDVTLTEDGLVLTEDRGTVVRLPASVATQLPDILKVSKENKTKDEEQRYVVTVRVRNYLDEDGRDPESGDTRFAFGDYRLMGFNVREVGQHGKKI